jgi:cytochrome P450
MGAHLARVEIEVMLKHLLDRVRSFEVTGPIQRLSSITNGSIKHLPIRFT